MRIVSLLDQEDVIEAHPTPSRALARGGARAFRHQPAGRNDPDPWLDDPFPDYDTEPAIAFSAS
jgi:hypothetical protein